MSPAAGWLPTPSLTALKAAIEVNGLAWVPRLRLPGAVLSMNQTVSSTLIVTVPVPVRSSPAVAKLPSRPASAQRVGEGVGAGEAGVGRVGEAAVGIERDAAARRVDDARGHDVGLRRRVGADRVGEELGVRAQVTWVAVEPLRMPLAALTTKVLLPTTL